MKQPVTNKDRKPARVWRRPPRFRADLIVQSIDGIDQDAYVVKDPSNGRFYRYNVHQIFLARHLDGEHSFEEISRLFFESFGMEIGSFEVGELLW